MSVLPWLVDYFSPFIAGWERAFQMRRADRTENEVIL
jgi:hypothetical protein